MTEEPRRRRLPPEERRRRILGAALELFARGGYRASMGEVARAAGVTRTVLYHYFPSKSGLFLSVLETQASELLRHLAPAVAGEGTQAERARRTVEAMLAFVEERPLAWQVLFDHRGEDEPEVAAAHRRIHATMMSAAGVLFASDMTSAGLEADSARAAVMGEMSLGAIDAVVTWWGAHPGVPRPTVADAAFDLLWHGVAGLPERAGGAARARAPRRSR
ncbi:MAG TPA: helix-turn-helix domain-containing protein [Solirubrobacteraceae bacterium]|jgi:AcrR family transcriptional regulator|nr:helix-turn-helix domain-containing protein [Solirubrobacteraceae bacterium]